MMVWAASGVDDKRRVVWLDTRAISEPTDLGRELTPKRLGRALDLSA